MRLLSFIFFVLLIFAPVAALPAPAQAGDHAAQTERTVAAARDVYVELTLESGDVLVRGWDRAEVRARTVDGTRIELRQYESDAAAGAESEKDKEKVPARRVEVFLLNSEEEEVTPGEPGGSGDVELSVPRGATLHLKVQSGDVEVSDVAEARIESASGDVDVSNVTKGVEIMALSGDVTLADSTGGVRLQSLSGEVEATNLKPNDDRDAFMVKSISGNINLESVAHAKVEGETTSGNVRFTGPLAARGGYKLRTTSGDVTMALPADSSFKVFAKVSIGGEVISDFPVKSESDAGKPRSRQILDGVVGGGDAEVSLTSFNGTVHLRKR
jgi:hypothetical protein